MRKSLRIAWRIITFPFLLLWNPFAFIFPVHRPQTTGRSDLLPLNYLNIIRNDRTALIEYLKQDIYEKNRMRNEVLTITKGLQATLFITAGTFLGVVLGIIAATGTSVSPEFIGAAWLLFFSFVGGTSLAFIDWAYERNRIERVHMDTEIGTLLLVENRGQQQDEQAAMFLDRTIDDLSHRPFWEIILLRIVVFFKNIAILLCYLAIFLITFATIKKVENKINLPLPNSNMNQDQSMKPDPIVPFADGK